MKSFLEGSNTHMFKGFLSTENELAGEEDNPRTNFISFCDFLRGLESGSQI